MGPYELLEKVVTVLERLQIRYLVTGSVASMAYGEPRFINLDLQLRLADKL